MIKKRSLLLLALCLVISIPACTTQEVVTGLVITGDSVEVRFPLEIDFSVTAASDTDITDIRLHYRVDRMSFANIASEILLEFEPSPDVRAVWTWDTRKTGGLPPGSSIDYWWTVTDASDRQIRSEPVKVRIEDERYSWKSITRGEITLYWYRGSDGFAEELMAAIGDILVHVEDYAGAVLASPVKMYIYASSADLRGAMVFPQEWTGGVAYAQYGTIAIGIAPENLAWGKRAIAHELTHLVIHQVTNNPYGGLPTWLDEGLAMNSEGELDDYFASMLEYAKSQDLLISVRSLSSPFSAFAQESILGYAQSDSIVRFLHESYGSDKLFELLTVFAGGSGYDEALLRVYGYDMDEMDRLWLDYVRTGTLAGAAPVSAGSAR